MPGTPANSPRFGAPRYADTDSAGFSAQVNGVTDVFDAEAAKLTPVVTTLPASPTDGDEVFFVADVANGVVWRLRYRAASTSAHKWEFVGGSPLLSGPVSGTFGVSNVGNTGSSGPAAITVPLAGDYDALFVGALSLLAGADLISDWTPPIAHGNYRANGSETQICMPICERYRHLGVAASSTIAVGFDNINGTGTASANEMQLWVQPVRVG